MDQGNSASSPPLRTRYFEEIASPTESCIQQVDGIYRFIWNHQGRRSASQNSTRSQTQAIRNVSNSSKVGSSVIFTQEVSHAFRVDLSSSLDIRCSKIQSSKFSIGTNMWRDFRILDISDTSVYAGFLACAAATSAK